MRVRTIASAPRWMYGEGCCITNLTLWQSLRSNISVHGEERVIIVVAKKVSRKGYGGCFRLISEGVCCAL